MTALALAPNGVKKPMLSNVIEEWFGNEFMKGTNMILPKTNIIEKDDQYLIELSVPGYQKEDFDIKVDKKTLIVSNSTQNEKETNENGYLLKEFSKNSFSKSFSLSDTIDIDKISAQCHDGILSIAMPKRDEAKSKPPRQIKIR